MLKPVEMSKVRAICMKAVAPSVIKELHNLSVLHIKDSQIPSIERSGPLSSFDDVSSRHLKIRSLLEAMGSSAKAGKKKIPVDSPLREADALISDSEAFFELQRQKEGLGKELDTVISLERAIGELAGLNVDFSKLSSGALQFMLLKASGDKAAMAKKAISAKKNFALAAVDGLLLVALPKQEEAKFLEQFGPVLPLPKISSTPAHEISQLKAEEGQIREKIAGVEKKISRFIESNCHRIVAVEEALAIESERARIATMFGASASLYYIEGWAEKAKFASLKSNLKEKFGKKVLVSEAPIDEHNDMPPTKLSNPGVAAPFQFLVDFLYTTGYREIDPSIIIFITIPLIYALIFGDAGYAVFSFLMASFMIKKSKPGSLLNQIASIWAVSAIPAFLAGVFFDEYFGFTHEHLFKMFGFGDVLLYEGMHRVSSINALMFICIMVGMLHLGLGFLLGAINEWGHSRKHAIAKLCWLGVELSGFFLVAGGMFNAYPEFFMPAAGLFVLSVGGMIATEGPIAAVEIPGLASNIMSYIRIAAVGVGGVILAEAINELLLPKLEFSPMGIIIFIITLAIYLAVHAVSCILAMFESFVHGARLNVVEFFGKFYKGNGIRFAPFSSRRVYSQEAD